MIKTTKFITTILLILTLASTFIVNAQDISSTIAFTASDPVGTIIYIYAASDYDGFKPINDDELKVEGAKAILTDDGGFNLELTDPNGKVKLTGNFIYLECAYCSITTIDLSQAPQLETLRCERNMIKEIDLSQNKQLRMLVINRNELTTLNLTNNPLLEVLDCGDNISGKQGLKEINLSNNRMLRDVYLLNNDIKRLDLSQSTQLSVLSVPRNDISEIILPNEIPNLKHVSVYENNLSTEQTKYILSKLPLRSKEKKGNITIIDTKNNKERNQCDKKDCIVALNNNWDVLDNNGNTNGEVGIPYVERENAIDDLQAHQWDTFIDKQTRKVHIQNAKPNSLVVLYNLLGERIASTTTDRLGQASINLINKSKGCYLIKLNRSIRKLILN